MPATKNKPESEIVIAEDVEPKRVEFFNVDQPWLKLLVSRDPQKYANPFEAQDKFAEFQAGLFSTSDPDIIEALNSPKFRAKGVRCKENAEDMMEYGSTEERKTWQEIEIERRVEAEVAARMAAIGHDGSSGRVSAAQDSMTQPPQE